MDVGYLPMAIHTYRLSCTIVQVLSRIRYLSEKGNIADMLPRQSREAEGLATLQ